MVKFNDVFGDIDWDNYIVSKEEAKEWFNNNKDKIKNPKQVWRDLNVEIISTVKNPAHRSEFLEYKSQGGDNDMEIKEHEYAIKSYEKQIAYAPAMVPEKDKEGDIYPPWVIQNAAHKFMINKNNDEVDTEHETPITIGETLKSKGTVVESWVTSEEKEVETVNGNIKTYPKNTWMVGIKFTDETWDKVKNGELTGYSISGIPNIVKNTETPKQLNNNNINMDNMDNQESEEENSKEKMVAELTITELFDMMDKYMDKYNEYDESKESEDSEDGEDESEEYDEKDEDEEVEDETEDENEDSEDGEDEESEDEESEEKDNTIDILKEELSELQEELSEIKSNIDEENEEVQDKTEDEKEEKSINRIAEEGAIWKYESTDEEYDEKDEGAIW